MEFFSTAATEGGGATVASFGSGNEGGRLQARATGSARRGNASAAEVRAVAARIRREGVTGRSAAARARRALLDQIDANRSGRGNIRRGILADIAADLADL